MESREPRVLAAGLERMAFERLAPFLRRDALSVDWVATAEAGVSMAWKNQYDVILIDGNPGQWPLERVVRDHPNTEFAESAKRLLGRLRGGAVFSEAPVYFNEQFRIGMTFLQRTALKKHQAQNYQSTTDHT